MSQALIYFVSIDASQTFPLLFLASPISILHPRSIAPLYFNPKRITSLFIMRAVLRALLEIFPQIDLRILRTVAVEYPSDVDTAVEFILSDVLPIINEPVETSYTHIVLDAERSLTAGQNLQVKDNQGRRITMSVYHNEIARGKESITSLRFESRAAGLELNLVADKSYYDPEKVEREK
ncbi:hypothetical protein Cni_G05533 [Canna indica]|uniref:CUE domain-containing protein n=1 Tax=Canna indica TaxID=4628 RepID=A0AAQ3Q3B8_9LILI|nr:hypothetical protein Cni_G05533 [Canna indica]